MKKLLSIIFVLFTSIYFVLNINCFLLLAGSTTNEYKALSTKELIEEIIYEDKIDEVYLFDDFEIGIAYYKNNNELFCELVNRTDAGSKLLEMYSYMKCNEYDNNYELDIIALLLEQNEILEKLSLREKIFASDILNEKNENTNIALLDSYSDIVLTSNGSSVEIIYKDYVNEDNNIDFNAIAMQAANYDVISTISIPTYRYNCHSYAWYSQDYNSNCSWMNNPSNYYLDNSYEVAQAKENYLMCYFANEVYKLSDGTVVEQNLINWHSSIISSVEVGFNKNDINTLDKIIVKSKWSYGGLYLHKGDKCPYAENFYEVERITYFDEQGCEKVDEKGIHGYEFSHIEIYKPRTNNTYNLSGTTSELNISRTINGNGTITDKYGMYELNVNSSQYYKFTIESNNELDNRLYDENMNLLSFNPIDIESNKYTFISNLSSQIYYLRTAFSNISNSGNINIKIEPHTHSYGDTYLWKDGTTHFSKCECGLFITEAHVVLSTTSNKCLLCNGSVDHGLVEININSSQVRMITVNGSYILIVLVYEDLKDYLNGTLLFYDKNLVTQ